MQSLWVLAAAFSFSLMAVCVKLIANQYSAIEILFYRCVLSLMLIGGFVVCRRYRIYTPHWRTHSRRAACGTFSMGVWFYTLGVLPIATAATLNYTSPIFIGILSAVNVWRSGRWHSIDWRLYVALGLGFVGVIVLLNPSESSTQLWPAVLGLFAAFVASFAFQDVKRLTALGEPEWRLVFYFTLYSALFAGAAMLVSDWHIHTVTGVCLLTAVAAFGTLGQLALSRAFGRGSLLLSAVLQYTGVIFAALWGILLLREYPSIRGWIGMSVIVVAGVASSLITKKSVLLCAANKER